MAEKNKKNSKEKRNTAFSPLFKLEWINTCKKLRESGYDLSKIYIIYR